MKLLLVKARNKVVIKATECTDSMLPACEQTVSLATGFLQLLSAVKPGKEKETMS